MASPQSMIFEGLSSNVEEFHHPHAEDFHFAEQQQQENEKGAHSLLLTENIDEDIDDEQLVTKISVDDKTEPKIGMIFDSPDEIMEFYQLYGKQKGFEICKRTCSKDDDGELKYITLACSRNGKSKRTSRKTLKLHPVTKTSCEAKLRAVRCADGKWLIGSIFLEHNHELCTPSKTRYYKSNRAMKPYMRRRLEINDQAGIRLNKNFNSLVIEAGGHENLTVLEKDCRNYIDKVRRLRLGDGDATAIQKYFLKMQIDNSSFFYTMDLDEEGRIKNLFWADARSRAAYREFGEVVTFDTTYLTNKYDMPFAPFVGVNHHGQSILFGCGLISNETTETFTWLFQSWLACMCGQPPAAIITDQDRAMQNAIEIVFPEARHRWCLWHIMKKIPEKLKSYKQYENIKLAFQNVVYDSLTCDEFEEQWNMFIAKFALHDNSWLSGLYNARRRWVPTFVKDIFWAGMSTTQRSESMNAFFDGYVSSKTSLKQFVEQYDNALRDKVEKENHEDFNSFNSWITCITGYEFEKTFQSCYTTTKFKEFQQELTGKICCDLISSREIAEKIYQFEVNEDMMTGEHRRCVSFTLFFNEDSGEINCNCRLFEFKGILCRHSIVVLIHKKVASLPDKYVLRRWRKDVKRCHTKVKVNYVDKSVNPETFRFDKMSNSFLEVADLAVDSDDKYNMVMDVIHELKKKLLLKEGIVSHDNEISGTGKKIRKVLTPLVVWSKGRPPTKRKQSKTEQIIQRRFKMKKTSEPTKHKRMKVNKMLNFEDFSSQFYDQEIGMNDETTVVPISSSHFQGDINLENEGGNNN